MTIVKDVLEKEGALEFTSEEVEQNKKESEDKIQDENPNQTKMLYQFAKKIIKDTIVSKEDSNQFYARLENDGHLETINLSSSSAVKWLRYNWYASKGVIYSSDSYKNALIQLESDAQFNGSAREIIYNRIAQNDKAIYYDLGDPSWSIVRITEQNYFIIPYTESMPTFRRTQRMIQQAGPWENEKNALNKLVKLLRIIPSEQLLFKVHIIHLFFQNYQTPIMVITGEHGSMKTTRTKAVKKLVDPTSTNSGSLPSRFEDIPNNFNNQYLAVFDNISGLRPKISDMFCRAITGEEIPKRKLYSDNDEFVFSYERKIILNGIAPTLNQQDFNDRSLFYETKYIPDNEKMTDSEFWERYDKLLPSVLHEIFNIISKTLKNHPGIGLKIQPKSRMADFEKTGETISQSMGYKPGEFLKIYSEKRLTSSLEGINDYPIVGLIEKLFEIERDSFELSMASFHQLLVDMADQEGIDHKSKFSNFPKLPNQIPKQIKILRPSLRRLGYDVRIEKYTSNDGKHKKNNSVIYINKIKAKDSKGTQNTLTTLTTLTSAKSVPDLSKSGKDRSIDVPLPVPLPENKESRHENDSGKHGKDGKHSLSKTLQRPYFKCMTCNAGPFLSEERTSLGLILDIHTKKGHSIQYLTEKQLSRIGERGH